MIYIVYRVVRETEEIDSQPEWWIVDTRDENERESDLVVKRCATKPEADEFVNTLNNAAE